MMQPAFLPWLGFFELISKVERFVFLDDFQFSVQSYHQRNRFFASPGKVDWQTVPVLKGVSFGAPLNHTQIAELTPWRKKMWKKIIQNYAKAPFFHEMSRELEAWCLEPAVSLAAQNIAFIRMACKWMGIECEYRLSSNRESNLKRSERVLDLLRWSETDCYYCARGSFGYMKADGIFPVGDIRVFFQDFHPQPYLQVGSPGIFYPNLSVLDVLSNVGSKMTGDMLRTGTAKWASWDEMLAVTNSASPTGNVSDAIQG